MKNKNKIIEDTGLEIKTKEIKWPNSNLNISHLADRCATLKIAQKCDIIVTMNYGDWISVDLHDRLLWIPDTERWF